MFMPMAAILPTGAMVHLGVHIHCLADVIAGRVQDAVKYTLETGDVSAGVDATEANLGNVIGSMVGQIINGYRKRG